METQLLVLLRGRKATRAIAERPVEPEKVQAILDAARLSASCANNQPWRFLVLDGDDPEALERGREALSRGNYWAKMAPVLIFAYSKPDLDCQIGGARDYYLFDLGMAVQNILLQATELDLVARPMAGFSPRKVREAFGLTDEDEVMVAVAVGYEGDVSTLSEKHREISRAPRQRKPLEEIVSFNPLPAGGS
ncbi:MAG: nitroreductase family protein [Chloroflexota bacterium]|nr:nitroreductase family protein [Chloroflexota bacterium]